MIEKRIHLPHEEYLFVFDGRTKNQQNALYKRCEMELFGCIELKLPICKSDICSEKKEKKLQWVNW